MDIYTIVNIVSVYKCIYISAKVLAVLYNNGPKCTWNHPLYSVSVVYGHSVTHLRHPCH